jgi:hypothetical protein
MMRFNWIVLMIGVFLVSGWALADPAPQFSANVMAPLHVMNYNDSAKFEIPQDWDSFQKELEIAKSIGVDAVSVDVWWGDVERRGDNRFDWTYYREIFRRIEEAGLRSSVKTPDAAGLIFTSPVWRWATPNPGGWARLRNNIRWRGLWWVGLPSPPPGKGW